jgi:hypothetical protein
MLHSVTSEAFRKQYASVFEAMCGGETAGARGIDSSGRRIRPSQSAVPRRLDDDAPPRISMTCALAVLGDPASPPITFLPPAHQGEQPGREMHDRPWRRAQGLQFVWREACNTVMMRLFANTRIRT